KVFLLGRVAVVGSANLSSMSVNELHEAALITDDARAVSGVRLLLENLVQAADEIDERFLRRIEKLPVVQAGRGSRRHRSIWLPEQRAWVINLAPIDLAKHADEQAVVDSERAKANEEMQFADSEPGYIRFTGTSNFRKFAKEGDSVLA